MAIPSQRSMMLLKFCILVKKGVHTDTIARLYISKETAKGNQLKDIQFPVIKFSKPNFHASSQYSSLQLYLNRRRQLYKTAFT